MLETIHYFIIVLLLVIIGLCSYITFKVKDIGVKKNIPVLPKLSSAIKNFKLSPGDGYKVVPGGDSKQININECNTCLQSGQYDPSDPSINSDPVYYYNGECHYSQESSAPPKGATIAVRGFQDTSLNNFTCSNPGKVSY